MILRNTGPILSYLFMEYNQAVRRVGLLLKLKLVIDILGVGSECRGLLNIYLEPTTPYIQRLGSQLNIKMKYLLAVLILLSTHLASATEDDLVAKISLPLHNSLVRADVPVWGLACGKDFKEYRVEYGKGGNPSSWILIKKSNLPATKDVCPEDLAPERQPLQGNLATWETGLTNYYYKDYKVDLQGIYTLRLVVTDIKGNVAEDRKTVEVGRVISNVFGGIAVSTDNKAKITFSEHSLYHPFLVISIKPVEEDIQVRSPYNLVGKIYQIRPPGIKFAKADLLEIHYGIDKMPDLDESKLGIYFYNKENDGWIHQETVVDTKEKVLRAKIKSFPKVCSFFAVLYNPNTGIAGLKEPKMLGKSWIAWPGTILEKQKTTTETSSNCYKILHNEYGGYFGVTFTNEEFNAKEFPIMEFDYKAPPDLRINVLVKVKGRWYDIVFTDTPKQYLRINMKKLGVFENVQLDNKWHHAWFNILEGLRKYTDETWVEEVILADFDSSEYMGLKPGTNPKEISYYIDNFCIRRPRSGEHYTPEEISHTRWQIGEDDGSNDELAYEKYEGQFEDSDTDDDFSIGDPPGEFERAVAFDDKITNIYFSVNEDESKDKYVLYLDVVDCDLREQDYVRFGVYLNGKIIDIYSCYLKKGALYEVPIEKGLSTGQNKITLSWIEGGNWISWDYISFQPSAYRKEIKVKAIGDSLYVNGERFLVKGIGYSPYRPGNLPWGERPSLETLEKDFNLIKEAGFNTIRTWTPLTEEELNLAKKHGLMVVQGIWLDPIADPFRISETKALSPILLNELKQKIKRYSKYDNILLYLIGNEIPAEGVYHTGVVETEKLLREMKETVKKVSSECRVSFSNWSQVLFLDTSFWDIIAYNLYPYYPATISHSLGYYGILDWLKHEYALNKPLLVTEYGLSVSPRGPGDFGYGGNTLEQQAEAVVNMYDDIIQAGTCGGCLFEWNDEWWKNHEFKGDEDLHNNEPEEWFGILGIVGVKDNYIEKLRPAYNAIKEYNQAIIVEPKKYNFYKSSVPIEVYTTESVYSVRFKLDDSEWIECKHTSTHWWNSKWKSKDKELSSHLLTVKAIGENGKLICKKQMKFWSGSRPRMKEPKYFVNIECKDSYHCEQKPELINVLFKITDEKDKPVQGVPVKYSFYETRLWEQVSGEKPTDEKGTISIDYYIKEPGYIIIAAGVDYKYRDFEKRFGSIKFIEVLLPENER